MAKKDTTQATPVDELNERLDKMEQSGMRTTKSWAGMWQESLRYFFSDQLHGKKKHKDWDWIILNYIWPSAIQEIAQLAKNHPKILTNPWEESDADYAETWQSILQWLWEKGVNNRGMRLEQIAAILDGKLFGYRVSKVFWEENIEWDDEKKEWTGDVKHRLWHPAYFWASDKENINDGSCGTVRYVTLEWAINRWPEFEEELTEEAGKFSKEEWGGDHIRGQLASAGTYPAAGKGGIDKGLGTSDINNLLNIILNIILSNNQQPDEDVKKVKLTECYFKDYSTTNEKLEEDIPQEELLASGRLISNGVQFLDPTGVPVGQENWPTRVVKKWKQPNYPNGRYVIRAGRTILNPGAESGKDVGAQQYPHKKWPFVVSPHYLLPHMWQGIDGVQLYKSTQDMINVAVSHLVNNMKQFGDPKVVVETGAIETPPGRRKSHFKIGSGAGAIIRLTRKGMEKFKILDPVAPSAASMQLYGLFSEEFKNILGLQDIAQGKRGTKITATEAHYLAISSNARIGLQSAYEDEWIKNVATLMAEVCQRNYSVGRFVRIVGQDKLIGITEIKQEVKDVRFDVDIVPGMTLPFDEDKRIEKYEKAYAMLQQPIANPMLPEMLRLFEIPGWKKLLDKYEAWQQFFQFYQLYEAVKAGQVLPEDAIRMLVQKATQLYQQEQAETVPAAPQEGEKSASRKQSAATSNSHRRASPK